MATHKYYPKKPTITTLIPFIRIDLTIETIAILSVVHTRKLAVGTIIRILTNALTQWVQETPEGKKAWKDSGEDFNIGDYALCEEQFLKWLPHAKLTSKGIQDIKLLYNANVDGFIRYDKVLVNIL